MELKILVAVSRMSSNVTFSIFSTISLIGRTRSNNSICLAMTSEVEDELSNAISMLALICALARLSSLMSTLS